MAFVRIVALAGWLTAGLACAAEPAAHWPSTAADVERRLARVPFEIRAAKSAGGGTTGAFKLELAYPDGTVLTAKWKRAPRDTLDGANNSARKELAAYAIQQWFLDPERYVVPPTAARCIALDAYRRWLRQYARPNAPGAACVFGSLHAWVKDVMHPEVLYEPTRFAADPVYADAMAELNLLTYLIDHHDGRRSNFLVAAAGRPFRIFSIDNGIAFGPWIYNYFVRNWHVLRVPALRRVSVERLRRVRGGDVARLGVLAEFAVDEAGVLQAVPSGANRKPRRGARVGEGTVQLGLTTRETAGVRRRLDDLLARVDAGEIALR